MDPVTLGAIGVLGLLALTRKQPVAKTVEKAPPKQDMPSAKPDTQLRDLASLATTGIIGLGIVTSVAASKLGASLTGNKLGETVGMLNAASGTAGNLVAAGARELFKVFGGSDEDATATAWQLMATGIGFAASTIVGILMLPSLVINAMIIGPIVGTIEDIARLSYGPSGAYEDAKKLFRESYDKFRAAIDQQFPEEQPYNRQIVAAATAYGFVVRTNAQRHKTWMKRAHGIGVSDKGHWIWGYERGMFLYGASLGDTSYSDVDIWNTYGERMYIPDFAPIRDSVSRVGSADQKAALADAIDVGDVFANVGHYIKAAGQPWGVGQSELSHLLWWRNAGYFEADDIVDGKLIYHGKTFDYKKANGVA